MLNAGGSQDQLVFPDHVVLCLIQLQIKPDVMPILLAVCMPEQVFALLKELVVDILLMEL